MARRRCFSVQAFGVGCSATKFLPIFCRFTLYIIKVGTDVAGMSAMGHKRTQHRPIVTCAFMPTPDIVRGRSRKRTEPGRAPLKRWALCPLFRKADFYQHDRTFALCQKLTTAAE